MEAYTAPLVGQRRTFAAPVGVGRYVYGTCSSLDPAATELLFTAW